MMNSKNLFKRILSIMIIPLIMVQTNSCTQDDDVETRLIASLQINVTAQDFASDNPETRASESGYVTTFISGDKIGVTVLSSANAILQDNIPCTYDGIAWTPDAGATITKVTGGAYLAYYPYSAAMNGKTTAAQILAAFTPNADQNDYADYTASDLMTGAGAVAGTTLTIGLAHALALIEVSLPATATAVTLKAGTTAVTPCKIGNSYRYIAKPQTGVTLSGGYTYLGETMAWEKTGVTLTAGKYTRVDVKSPIISKTINGIEAVAIPRGTFTMGSPYDETGRYSDETQHQVTLTQDFYMSRYEITNAQYAAFLNANGIGSNGQGSLTSDGAQTYILDCTQDSRSQWGVRWNVDKWEPASGKENFPVIYVSWYGAKAFAGWVGGSLPTEAQWEYTCRAGTSTAYSYGASADDNYMWYSSNSGSATHAAGTKLPNAWDLYDMHGNVYEWCEDSWNGSEEYGTGAVTDPVSPNSGSYRVLRGGDWSDYAPYCRSAYRYSGGPDGAGSSIGFRVVFVP